jgi:hypothetical protein
VWTDSIKMVWVPPVPSVATMRETAVLARDCVWDCNNAKRFRASVVTSVCVLMGMLLLSSTSMWAARRGAAGAIGAAGGATVGATPPDGSAAAATTIRRAAVLEHDAAARETDGHDRRRRAAGALGMLRAAEQLVDPSQIRTRLGFDVVRLRAALASM